MYFNGKSILIVTNKINKFLFEKQIYVGNFFFTVQAFVEFLRRLANFFWLKNESKNEIYASYIRW